MSTLSLLSNISKPRKMDLNYPTVGVCKLFKTMRLAILTHDSKSISVYTENLSSKDDKISQKSKFFVNFYLTKSDDLF